MYSIKRHIATVFDDGLSQIKLLGQPIGLISNRTMKINKICHWWSHAIQSRSWTQKRLLPRSWFTMTVKLRVHVGNTSPDVHSLPRLHRFPLCPHCFWIQLWESGLEVWKNVIWRLTLSKTVRRVYAFTARLGWYEFFHFLVESLKLGFQATTMLYVLYVTSTCYT